ncbi:acyl-CoA dehydrogenase family protein [Micromonospora sp. HUAS LYJ1]|nr:acyl-CoA dehydrogenase family protein [Micromonospora sp. HUAS LYJ1]WKU02987.1 acyl-CoA dehydrogenase family protein [Micromonospora sp. HUAS LYJ1]
MAIRRARPSRPSRLRFPPWSTAPSQLHGAAALSPDTPLAQLAALTRVLRIADGPDEVHRRLVARAELRRHGSARW